MCHRLLEFIKIICLKYLNVAAYIEVTIFRVSVILKAVVELYIGKLHLYDMHPEDGSLQCSPKCWNRRTVSTYEEAK
jgi:hypothetical protein